MIKAKTFNEMIGEHRIAALRQITGSYIQAKLAKFGVQPDQPKELCQ